MTDQTPTNTTWHSRVLQEMRAIIVFLGLVEDPDDSPHHRDGQRRH